MHIISNLEKHRAIKVPRWRMSERTFWRKFCEIKEDNGNIKKVNLIKMAGKNQFCCCVKKNLQLVKKFCKLRRKFN